MKKILAILFLFIIALLALAVPAKPGLWRTVKTADGKIVRVQLQGDEFCSFWQTTDGQCLVEDPQTGLYINADINLMVQRATDTRHKIGRSMVKGWDNTGTKAHGQTSPYTGKKKGLIILVEFKDRKFKGAHTPELYNRIVNEIGYSDPELGFKGSVKDYFLAQSHGLMEFDFDIVGPVEMPYSYKYYGRPSATGADDYQIIGNMIADACKAVDDEVDFTQYDWDGNKDVEQVFVIYAGYGQASYPDAYTIWPHKSSIYAGTGKNLFLDGVRVDTYACSCELGTNGKIDGIGTICHEFSHCLGLPDFYDIENPNNGAYGMGQWSLMCTGGYNGNSFCPANYTAYERMCVGWLTPEELKENCQIEGMKSLADSQEAYIIYNDNFRDEFYMLENRQQKGWDEALPNSGLLITHVDYDSRIWSYNNPNSPTSQKRYGITNPHERCAVVLADNTTENAAGDIYPYAQNDSLTGLSLPAAMLYNANSDGSYNMNKAVKGITRNEDGTVSFSFENHNKNEGDYDLPDEYIFYESFDKCAGAGGNDGLFSGSTVGKGTFSGRTDHEGWTSNSPHAALRCAMFGSSLISGQVTTPEFEIDGECHLLFKAAPYTDDGTGLTLEIATGNANLSETSLSMTNERWTVFDIAVTGTGPVKINMKAEGRFFLDKVCVTGQGATGINDLKTDNGNTPDGDIYSIDGRYVGRNPSALKKGIYIMNGKKIIK